MSKAASLIHLSQATLYEGEVTTASICHHEAGHAVLHRLCRLPFDTIGVRINYGYSGTGDPQEIFAKVASNDQSLRTSAPLPDVAPEFRKPLALRRACCSLAGLQSELMLHGIEPDGPVIRQDADHERAKQALIDGFGDDSGLYFAQLKTRDYLSRCWLHVHDTARELLRRFDANGEGVLCADNPEDARYFQPIPGWNDE